MSRSFGIPEGFAPLDDALRRAADNWGQVERVPRLWGLLRGTLPAYRADKNGDIHPIPADFWRNPNSERVLLQDQFSDEITRNSAGRPVFREAELDEHVPWLHQRRKREGEARRQPTLATKPVEQTKRPGKGGHPEEFDWEAMWIEIVRIMRDEGMPAKSVDLRKRMQVWFGDHHPTDNTIRPKIDRLFQRLNDPDQETQQ